MVALFLAMSAEVSEGLKEIWGNILMMNYLIKFCLVYLAFPTDCQSYSYSKFAHPLEMAQTPFTLRNGEYYRDMYTIANSRLVADMARKHQQEMDHAARINKEKLRIISWSRVSPKFYTKYPYRKGKLKSDEEIFDFTDSRLINPPKMNQYPHQQVNIYVKESETHAPKLPLVQISYSYGPSPFRQPRYHHYGDTNTITNEITGSRTYRVRNKPYSGTFGRDRNNYRSNDHSDHTLQYRTNDHTDHNYRSHDHTNPMLQYRTHDHTDHNYKTYDNPDHRLQYSDDLFKVTSRQKTSNYPYHIFDKSGSVSAYKYPYDESKYLYSHPEF